MKKVAFVLFLFLSVAGFLNCFESNVSSAYAEDVETVPDLSSLPTLPYDFRGSDWETHYLKNRVVFKNVNGEYMAFDVEDGAKTGLNLVWWNKWNPYGYQDLLPHTPLMYANFVPGSVYNSYKLINGEWVYQNYADDGNSFDFYADWVLAPGVRIVYSSADLINANGQTFSYTLGTWIDGTLEDYRDNAIYSASDYSLALPAGLYSHVLNGGVILSRTDSSPKYICADGIDNDNDGAMDEDDPGCHTDWDVNNSVSYNPKTRSEDEDNIKRLPVQPDGTEINSGSGPSTFSSDGKLIAYASITYTGGWYNNTRSDIFVYDTATGTNERINLAPDGKDANSQSGSPAISSDGSYVVFQSSATNLVPDKTDNFSSDIFVRDLAADTTILVSKGLDGKAAGHCTNPSIGGKDGKYISFESEAGNLVPNDTNGRVDVFVYNMDTKEIKCVSSTPNGASGNGYSYMSSLSSASDLIAFSSSSSNLLPDDTNGGEGWNDVFVCNLDTDEIERVSLSYDGKQVSGSSNSASISPDGRYVSFYSNGSSFVPDDTDRWADTFVYDRTNKTLERISVSADGQQGNSESYQAYLSMGGKYVVFFSYADNLVSGDTNGAPDVFIRNQATHEIKRLNIASDGAQANNHSYPAAITPDGKYVLITSVASNLVKGDVNNTTDTFMVKNPFWKSNGADLSMPTELKQRNVSDGAEIGLGKIINEGAAESSDSVFLSAKVGSSDGGRVALEVEIIKISDSGEVLSLPESVTSDFVAGGGVATIDYVPRGGVYSWKARSVDETGKKSDWVEFGNNNATEADFISSNFSFVFLTDVHLGSFTTAISKMVNVEQYYESQTYPRFTDVLYEIENLNPKPDFILVGGDNVEYNNERWLYDFKSIIDNYSERTGIEVYVVPGNHDRYDSESSAFQWGETDLSGGNDDLKNYFEVMKKPEGVTSLFAENADIMNAESSELGGYNRYNYYFNHNGFQFIGLDSGEDTGVSDTTPESKGLSNFVTDSLESSVWGNLAIPKIIFMHNTVWNNIGSGEFDNDNILGGVVVPDGAISNNWANFITYCAESDVQLVLSGHTHNDLVFNSLGNETVLSDWSENKTYPLYLQTQSASKDDNGQWHGYRLINVQNGKAIPLNPVENVPKYEKVFADLDSKKDLDLLAYDSDGKKITMESDSKATMFVAEDSNSSNRKIIYDDIEDSKFEVKNNNSFDTYYDLQLQKREEGAEIEEDYIPVAGYQINNPELCGPSEIFCSNFIYLKKKSGYTILGFEDVKIRKESSNIVSADWSRISADSLPYKMDGVNLKVNGNSNTTYRAFPVSFTADLGSPGELRVYDEAGNVTGVVDGEIVENIPYSIYVPESETVYVFGNTRQDVVDGLKTQVVGSYEDTYDLTLTLSENNEEKAKFTANDILINDRTTHQFSVNWEALERDEKGVTMQFNEDKDTVFERSIPIDGSLSFPKAKLSAEKYATNEGTEFTFDGSLSSDSDGNITLYEWDFDEDGFYEANSSAPTMAHTYGDDFLGKVFLKVTDNEGLTDKTSVTSADVTVTNMNPTVSISKLEIADTMDKFMLEGDFTDSGWLDKHTALIDWGDGNVEQGISLTEENISPDTTGKITATHKYSQLQNYVVKLMVEDDNGGRTTSEITLESPKQIKQVALLRLKAIQTDNKNVRKEIDKAIGSLEESLSSKYWKEDFHLNPSSAPKFFSEEQKAIKSLEKILEDKKKNESFQDTQEIQKIRDKLSYSDIFLAKIMVYEAGSLLAKDLKSAKSWIDDILKR